MSKETPVLILPMEAILESDNFKLRLKIKDIDSLADDMKERGQLSPLFVRPKAEGKYELVSGYRRFEALKKIGAKETLARIFSNLTEDQALGMAVAENDQRNDLTPLEKALLCKRLQEGEKSRKEIAAIVFPAVKGATESERNVQNYLTVAKSDELIINALTDEAINFSVALLLAEALKGKKSEDVFTGRYELQKVINTIIKKELSVREAGEYIDYIVGRREGKPPTKKERKKWEPVTWKQAKRGGWKFELKFKETVGGKPLDERTLNKMENEVKKVLEKIKEYRKEKGKGKEE